MGDRYLEGGSPPSLNLFGEYNYDDRLSDVYGYTVPCCIHNRCCGRYIGRIWIFTEGLIIMVEEFKTLGSVGVTISHYKLVAPVTGFAMEGVSECGTVGTLIFIPTGSSQTLIDLSKV